jgi:hypothetical protein
MTTQTLEKPATSVPFTLCFVKEIDKNLYEEAVNDSELLKISYNPETQTSNIPVYAGTSLTYRDSYSGILNTSKDDTEQSDT